MISCLKYLCLCTNYSCLLSDVTLAEEALVIMEAYNGAPTAVWACAMCNLYFKGKPYSPFQRQLRSKNLTSMHLVIVCVLTASSSMTWFLGTVHNIILFKKFADGWDYEMNTLNIVTLLFLICVCFLCVTFWGPFCLYSACCGC